MTTHLAEFGRIDQTQDAGYFIRFLDEVCAQASAQSYKRHLLESLALRPGVRVLDIGCGTGDDARTMAALVAPGGRIVGVDNSTAMIDEANKRAAGADLPIEFHAADVLHLPFADASFDCSQADRSLMHVPDPGRALAEMLRVTKPGGHIAVFEVDFDTLTIDVDDRPMARKILTTWSDSVRDGWLGRRIPALVTDLGLQDVRVFPHTLMLTPGMALRLLGAGTVERAAGQGTITRSEGEAWLAQVNERVRRGRFFSTLTGFLVAGRK